MHAKTLSHICLLGYLLLSPLYLGAAELPYAYIDSLITITNPISDLGREQFGDLMTGVGNDHIAIGEPKHEVPPDAFEGPYGGVLIFDTEGTLLSVITNSITSINEPYREDLRFMDIAAASDTSFFVSRPFAVTTNGSQGVIYEFDLAGNVLNTITNPVSGTPNDLRFGHQLKRVGNNMFLASTYGGDLNGFSDNCVSQRVHVLTRSGQELLVLSRVDICDFRGSRIAGTALAAIPGQRFLLATFNGTQAGVNVFDLAGQLVKSIEGPTVGEFDSNEFGVEIQALNTDTFGVADPLEFLAGGRQGRVRLYDRDGNFRRDIEMPETITATFSSPGFGYSIAALTDDIFAVGAPHADAAGLADKGAVYLFDQQGLFLQKLSPPLPALSDTYAYGRRVLGIGTNRLAVAADGKVHIYELSFGLSDPFEPDNTPAQARAFAVGQEETHSIHRPGDEDWIRFYLTTNYNYFIETDTDSTNVDVVLDVYFQNLDGTLTPVSTNFNQNPRHVNGLGGEFLFFTPNQSGTYLVSAKDAQEDSFGEDHTYDLKVSAGAPGFTALAVVAVDLLSPGREHSPSGTVIVIDGGTPIPMNGANTMVFREPDITAGATHSVEVRVPPGYLPEQDPIVAHSVADPMNPLFGNPKQVNVVEDQWNFYVYAFAPSIQLGGRLRDASTGGWIGNADLYFESASGVFSGLVYTQYPFAATYAVPWLTDADGNFPTNVVLPDGHWHLRAFSEDVGWIVVSNILQGLGPGVQTNLNLAGLMPLDANTNGIADHWEHRYFQGSISGRGDFDGDGFSERLEYLLGTSPISDRDVFAFSTNTYARTGGTVTISWQAASGRSYQLNCKPSMLATNWATVFGPWTAPSTGPVNWHATNSASHQIFRLDALLP